MTSFLIYSSASKAAETTSVSMSPVIFNSIGESKLGPPRSASASTIIPGIPCVTFVTSCIISKPLISLSEGSTTST